jgi:hypothetical protein
MESRRETGRPLRQGSHAPAHGLSLAFTLGMVAAGVVIQVLVMAPPARGAARVAGPAPARTTTAVAPVPARPYGGMTAGMETPGGSRSPAQGWKTRRIDLPAGAPVSGAQGSPRPSEAAQPPAGGQLQPLRADGSSAAIDATGRAPQAERPPEASSTAASTRPAPVRPASPSVGFLPIAVPPAPAPAPGTTPPVAQPPAGATPGDGSEPAGDGEAELEPSIPEPEMDGIQMLVVGPSSMRQGETGQFRLVVENAADLSHAPLRLAFDPEVLEFVEAVEGDLLSSGGGGTRFQASEAEAPGLVDIAVSRGAGRGAATRESGTLCTVTLRAKAPGLTPLVTSGSRLLDSSSRPLGFRRNDVQVAVN